MGHRTRLGAHVTFAALAVGGACVPDYTVETDRSALTAGAGADAGTGGSSGGRRLGGSGGIDAGMSGNAGCDACGAESGNGGDANGGFAGAGGTESAGEGGEGCGRAGCGSDAGPCAPGPSYPCQNGGVCTSTGSSFRCGCPKGFTGDRCELDDPCVPNPCQHAGRCTSEPFACECTPPFGGDHCESSPACHDAECNGFWHGTVTGAGSDETPLRFEVRGGGLAMVWVGLSSRKCGVIRSMTSLWTIAAGIAGTSIDSKAETDNDGLTYRLQGGFDSMSTASGSLTLQVAMAGCNDLLTLAWSASKALCGDGQVDFPETCDGGPTDSSTCDASCQLPAYLEDEHEPNDDGSPAVDEDDLSTTVTDGPFTDDTLIYGVLVPAGDEDVFTVTNAAPVGRTLLLDTYGPSMGSCGVDTELVLHPTSGASPLVSAGGGILPCAAASYYLPAYDSVLVQVREGSDEHAIPGYHLVIRFTE